MFNWEWSDILELQNSIKSKKVPLYAFLASQDALEVIVWVSEWVSQSQSYWL